MENIFNLQTWSFLSNWPPYPQLESDKDKSNIKCLYVSVNFQMLGLCQSLNVQHINVFVLTSTNIQNIDTNIIGSGVSDGMRTCNNQLLEPL